MGAQIIGVKPLIHLDHLNKWLGRFYVLLEISHLRQNKLARW
jgi:hypothetical protein